MKAILVALFALLLATISFSANISGTFYSAYTLEPMDGQVVLEAKGPVDYRAVFLENYSIDLAPGIYSMEAYTLNGTMVAEPKNVTVENGTTMDFVLSYAENIKPNAQMDWRLVLLAVSALFIIIAIIIFVLTGNREMRQELAVEGNRGLSEDEDRLLLILYENEGTIEQTELRTQTSWSDAKASLLARSLEAQGYIRRIRKGKKNIIKTTEKGNAFNQQRRQ